MWTACILVAQLWLVLAPALVCSAGLQAALCAHLQRCCAHVNTTCSTAVLAALHQVNTTSLQGSIAAVHQLRRAGHADLVVFTDQPVDPHLQARTAQQLQDQGSTFTVIQGSDHHYLPSHLAQAFEAYAWLCDRHGYLGRPQYDAVLFLGRPHLAYYTALAKLQAVARCGLAGTLLLVAEDAAGSSTAAQQPVATVQSVEALQAAFLDDTSASWAQHLHQVGPAPRASWASRLRAAAGRFAAALQRGLAALVSLVAAAGDPAALAAGYSSSCSHDAAVQLALRVAALAADSLPAGYGDALRRDAALDLPLVSVVITHYNRYALLRGAVQSVAEQAYPQHRLQLVVLDDGSPDPAVPPALDELARHYDFGARGWLMVRERNRYLGGARNRAAQLAAGRYVLFMDDDNLAKPGEVAAFAAAMQASRAHILTSFVDFVFGGDEAGEQQEAPVPMSRHVQQQTGGSMQQLSPSFVFLGGSADVGLFQNCYGDANSFFDRQALLSLGGYSTDRGIGYEDWELYSKAALQGYDLQVLPLAVYWYRFTSESMQKSTSYYASRQRALRPYLQLLQGQ